MKKFIFILIVLFSFMSQSAMAVDPEAGWWWNPAESGRGFSIEQQGNNIFFAAYLYDDSGKDAWYIALVTKNAAGDFTGNLLQFSGGQTLLGAYQPAKSANSNVGAIKLAFNSASTGTMTWPGGVVPIERFGFAGPITPPTLNLAPSSPGSGRSDYNFSTDFVNLTNAPADTDYESWGMLSDSTAVIRLYFFKQSSDTQLYEFIFDGFSLFNYGRFTDPKVIDAPANTDTSNMAFVNTGGSPNTDPKSIMYMRKKNSRTLYPFEKAVSGDFTYDKIGKPFIDVLGSPADADFSRWAMDAVSIPDPTNPSIPVTMTSFYTFKADSNTEIYVHEYDPAANKFFYVRSLAVTNTPANGNTTSFAAVFSKPDNTRFLFQQTR